MEIIRQLRKDAGQRLQRKLLGALRVLPSLAPELPSLPGGAGAGPTGGGAPRYILGMFFRHLRAGPALFQGQGRRCAWLWGWWRDHCAAGSAETLTRGSGCTALHPNPAEGIPSKVWLGVCSDTPALTGDRCRGISTGLRGVSQPCLPGIRKAGILLLHKNVRASTVEENRDPCCVPRTEYRAGTRCFESYSVAARKIAKHIFHPGQL